MNIELGKIIEGESEAERDAIHVAVAPVIAGECLLAGQHVGVSFGYAYSHANKIGIVDPILKTPVLQGQRFWLWMYPHTVENLRHDWDHPAFGKRHVEPDEFYSEATTTSCRELGCD